MKKLLSALTLVAGATALTACKKGIEPGTVRIDLTSDGKGWIVYNENTPYEGLDGKEYVKGELNPTWSRVSENLLITFDNVTNMSSSSMSSNFTSHEASKFANVDILGGNASKFNEHGTSEDKSFINLNDYLDQLPAFKKFLQDNPLIKKQITAADGGIYYAPFFDGYDDVMRMFMLRHDWVKTLLDGTPTYDTAKEITVNYEQYFQTAASHEVKLTTKSAKVTKTIPAQADNIIALQNAQPALNGANACSTLKSYINTKYVSNSAYGYTKNSDLFLSTDAAYDADELVALMRCVKTNPALLTGNASTDINVFFMRDFKTGGTDIGQVKNMDVLASIFGVRGLDVQDAVTYIDGNGIVHTRKGGEADITEGLNKLSQLYKEGLITTNYNSLGANTDFRAQAFTQGNGFMTFDYNASTTERHDLATTKAGIDFQSVLPPLTNWSSVGLTGLNRYTESVRSVKTNAWGIPAHVANNKNTLDATLRLLDYPWSTEGHTLLTYGPSEYLEANAKFTYKGQEYPKFTAAALADKAASKLDATNYLRRFLGATLPIGSVKDQACEAQFYNKQGNESITRINDAILNGALGHAGYDKTNSSTAYQVPLTVYPLTDLEAEALKTTTGFLAYYDTNFHNVIKGTMTAADFKTNLGTQGNYSKWQEYYTNAFKRSLKA